METNTTTIAKRCRVSGQVQGVGFRPFVYRLATQFQLNGYVRNDVSGVTIQVEGKLASIQSFIKGLTNRAPVAAVINSLMIENIAPKGYKGFSIERSANTSHNLNQYSALLPQDLALCEHCRQELFDSNNRRYRYPFINCTQCGPRYTIIEGLPYDRSATTMARFQMCPQCLAEYCNPTDRRFHAEPNACSVCGPKLWLSSDGHEILASGEDAIERTVGALRDGLIVAVKGIGGFHLMVDATNQAALERLRSRKHRPHKPFALMVKSLEVIADYAQITTTETQVLSSRQAPIVLLRKRKVTGRANKSNQLLAEAIAPDSPNLGIMLPYTGLHHLLLEAIDRPLVATSGNLSDEPICADNQQAKTRLAGVADLFLLHDRDIVHGCDDAIVQCVKNQTMLLRRGRGYTPYYHVLGESVKAKSSFPVSNASTTNFSTNKEFAMAPGPAEPLEPTRHTLALGGQLKNSFAMASEGVSLQSQHFGDLDSIESVARYQHEIEAFKRTHALHQPLLVCDRHPDYHSTRLAEAMTCDRSKPLQVQHHFAHVAAVMAEFSLPSPVLGIAWDGGGYGDNHSIWGGEFIWANKVNFTRVSSLRPFRLPGGEQAIKQPKRIALALLYESCGDAAFTAELPLLKQFSNAELKALATMIKKGINAPWCTSVGRLFDGVAALLGQHHQVSFEGQAAMGLENLATEAVPSTFDAYPYKLDICDKSYSTEASNPLITVDWREMVVSLLSELPALHKEQQALCQTAYRFHRTLVLMLVDTVKQLNLKVEQLRHAKGLQQAYKTFSDVEDWDKTVVLGGGCFQNRLLLTMASQRLQEAGYTVYFSQRIPINDGGISWGQLEVAKAYTHSKQLNEP